MENNDNELMKKTNDLVNSKRNSTIGKWMKIGLICGGVVGIIGGVLLFIYCPPSAPAATKIIEAAVAAITYEGVAVTAGVVGGLVGAGMGAALGAGTGEIISAVKNRVNEAEARRTVERDIAQRRHVAELESSVNALRTDLAKLRQHAQRQDKAVEDANQVLQEVHTHLMGQELKRTSSPLAIAKHLNSVLKDQVSEECLVIVESITDPITQEIMTDPVSLPSGKSIDRKSINYCRQVVDEKTRGKKYVDPFDSSLLFEANNLIPNRDLRNLIELINKHFSPSSSSGSSLSSSSASSSSSSNALNNSFSSFRLSSESFPGPSSSMTAVSLSSSSSSNSANASLASSSNRFLSSTSNQFCAVSIIPSPTNQSSQNVERKEEKKESKEEKKKEHANSYPFNNINRSSTCHHNAATFSSSSFFSSTAQIASKSSSPVSGCSNAGSGESVGGTSNGHRIQATHQVLSSKRQRKPLLRLENEEQKEILNLIRTQTGFDPLHSSSFSEGDCFFDSVAQALEAKGIEIQGEDKELYKRVRVSCKKYMEWLQKASDNWIEHQMEKEAMNGGDSYRTCLGQIEYTHDEIEAKKIANDTSHKYYQATWGRTPIEGRMICNIFKVKLCVIEILRPQEFQGAGIERITLAPSLISADGKKEDFSYQQLSDRMRLCLSDKRTITLVNYKGHFSPLLQVYNKPVLSLGTRLS